MAQPVTNAHIYKEDWEIKLQQELDEPTKWREICNVRFTDDRVLHNPYGTDPTVQTGFRGSPGVFQAVTQTDESTLINTFKRLDEVIDWADYYQSTYANQMTRAERQGILLNEEIEKAVYEAFGSMTVFDGDEIGGAVGSITLSATNVDDVIRGITREIGEASGQTLYQRNGGFFVWRPTDFEKLTQYAQSMGFQLADHFLSNGMKSGVDYGGFTHYTSNLLSGGHVIAGVKKTLDLGILRSTYGKIVVDDKNPAQISGIGISTRVDFKPFVWLKTKPVLFDVRIA